MKATLNIGMNNNPLHWMDLSRKLAFKTHGVEVETTELISGTYQGEPEETLVVRLKNVKMTKDELENWLEFMCMALNQECIAVKSKVLTALVYNPTLEIERQEFNYKYFLV